MYLSDAGSSRCLWQHVGERNRDHNQQHRASEKQQGTRAINSLCWAPGWDEELL